MHLALDLSLPVDSRFLAATRKVLAVYLLEFGAPAGVVDDIILAMDEACTNVVRHAYPANGAGNYGLRADLDRDRVRIEVSDNGVGFHPKAHQSTAEAAAERPEVSKLAENGRGMEVMRRLMTSVEVESPTAAGGTCLRLSRVLPPSVD